MSDEELWEYFRGYNAKGLAGLVSTKLQMEGIPNRIEKIEPKHANGTEYWILVAHEHLQRASMIRAQLPLGGNELTYLSSEY